jgi:hypothetical protein
MDVRRDDAQCTGIQHTPHKFRRDRRHTHEGRNPNREGREAYLPSDIDSQRPMLKIYIKAIKTYCRRNLRYLNPPDEARCHGSHNLITRELFANLIPYDGTRFIHPNHSVTYAKFGFLALV